MCIRDRFQEYLLLCESLPLPEYILKAWAVAAAASWLGIEGQNRDTQLAISCASDIGQVTLEEKRRSSRKALQADAAWGSAWFNAAIVASGESRPPSDFMMLAFAMAGICDTSDVVAWSNATLACLVNPDFGNLIAPIVGTAYRYGGDKFVSALLQRVDLQEPPIIDRSAALALIEQVVDLFGSCLLYTSPSPRDATLSRMPSSA